MNKTLDVLTLGDLCADLVVSGKDVVPQFGQKEKMLGDYSLEMGGSTSIFACQAAKLGLNTALIGKVGDDEFGALIRKTLKQAGVSLEYVKTDPAEKTGLTVILNAGNDRAIMTYAGTIDAVAKHDVPDALLKATRHFHIGSYFLMKRIQPHYPALLKKLKKYGVTISLDTNWDPAEKWDSGIWKVLPLVDIFFPNANEARLIARERSLEQAVKKLQKVVPVLVIKKGEQGAEAYAGGKKFAAPALKLKVVDTVGAGDSFDAGFLYGFLSGKSIADALEIGCLCGSLNTAMPGGTRGQPVLKMLGGASHVRAPSGAIP
jgi:sugar/nucleoside kinase (ribokinase family)